MALFDFDGSIFKKETPLIFNDFLENQIGSFESRIGTTADWLRSSFLRMREYKPQLKPQLTAVDLGLTSLPQMGKLKNLNIEKSQVANFLKNQFLSPAQTISSYLASTVNSVNSKIVSTTPQLTSSLQRVSHENKPTEQVAVLETKSSPVSNSNNISANIAPSASGNPASTPTINNIADSPLVIQHKIFKTKLSPNIYIFENGALHLIPDSPTLKQLGFTAGDAYEISEETFSLFKISDPIDTVITPFSTAELGSIKILIKRFLSEEGLIKVSDGEGAKQSYLDSFNQLLADFNILKEDVIRSVSIQRFTSGGGGGGGTVSVGSTDANVTGSTVTGGNVKLSGNGITTTSGNLSIDSTGGATTISDNLIVTGTTTFGGIAYTWPSADGSANQRLTTNSSGVLSWATVGGVSSNSLDFDEFVNSMTLDASLTINRGTGNFFFGIGSAPSTVFEVQGTASASYLLTGNTLQVGGFASAAYSRFGTDTTGYSNFISTSNDLLISGDLEVNATAQFDSFVRISNTATASLTLFSDSATNTQKRFTIQSNYTGSGKADRLSILGGDNLELFSIASSGITEIDTLRTGPISFDDNAGVVSWTNIEITSASADTIMSYSAQIDSSDVLTIYGATAASNTVKNLRVGIRTTTPSTVFEVQGTASASYLLTGNTLQVGGFASAAYNRFGISSTTNANYISTSNDVFVSGDLDGLGSLSFTGTASLSNALWVSPGGYSGNVGIGTTAPTDKLAVYGGISTLNGGHITIDSAGGGQLRTNSAFGAADIQNPGTGSGSGLRITGANNANSFLTLKSTGGVGTSDYINFLVGNNGATEAMRITTLGRVGLGITAPKGPFFLVDSRIGSTSSGSFAIRSSNTIGSVASISATSLTSGNLLQLTVPASTSGGGAYLLVQDTAGVVYASLSNGGRFSIRRSMFSRGADTTNCTGVGTPSAGCIDYAENMPTDDLSMGAGDLVSLDNNSSASVDFKVQKSVKSYDSSLLGVVSTNPAVLITGTNVKLGDEANNFRQSGMVPIALAGRVPVKVSFENGDIKKGDYLTSSAVPGKAMRAAKKGRVIGIALESAAADSGKTQVMVFINPHWAGEELDANGQLADFSGQSLLDTNDPIGLFDKFIDYLKSTVVSVKKLVAQIIETEKVVTKQLEIKDSITGEIYCVGIANGEWQKVAGECVSSAPAQTTTPIPNPVLTPELTSEPTEGGELVESTPEVSPDLEPIPQPSPSPESLVPSLTPEPPVTPSPTPTISPTPELNPTPSPTPSPTPVLTPTATPTSTPESPAVNNEAPAAE